MKVFRTVAAVALGGMLFGCAGQPPSGAGAAPAPPAVSFDGMYRGTVQNTGAGSGIDPKLCAVDPALSLQVSQGAFTYVQPHPAVVGTAPALTAAATTATYSATIAADGTISGTGGDGGGTMTGRVTGGHMAGQINGVLCYYSFSADRI